MSTLPSTSFPFTQFKSGVTSSLTPSSGAGMDPITIAALIGAGTNLFGGWMSGRGQQQMTEADRRHQLQTLQAQLLQNSQQFETTRGDNLGRLGLEVAQATPNRVDWRQNQAIRAAIMPELRNVSIQAPAGYGGYVPQISGGFRIPEGGFSAETLRAFSPEARLQGEEDLDMAGGLATGGRISPPSYGTIYGAPGVSASSRVSSAMGNLRQQDQENETRRKTAMLGALIPPPRGR